MRTLRLITLIASAVALAAPLSAESTPLAREQFLSELSRNLSSHFNLEGDLQLELIRAWAPPAQLAEAWNVEVIEYPSLPTSSMLLRCRILADGANVSDATVVLRAILWRDVWQSRQPIASGSSFDASLLEVRRVDAFRERDALPATVGDRSYVMLRAVGPGRLLSWHDIGRRPLVRKGSLVEVSAADGQLVITMKALAMENGAQGDTVTVRNPESRRDFAAMVVDENRVQVRF